MTSPQLLHSVEMAETGPVQQNISQARKNAFTIFIDLIVTTTDVAFYRRNLRVIALDIFCQQALATLLPLHY
jgi:hypothetical protein